MRHLVAPLFLVAAAALLAQSASTYRITHTYALGGDGGWDYVIPDPAQHRVFIGRLNRVMVVDENDGTLIGEVTGINGAHGVALVDRAGHGFATSGNDGSVVMFDLKTFKPRPHPRRRRCRSVTIGSSSGCRSGVMAISDYQAAKVVTTVPIGAGVDGAGYDPATSDAFASSLDGTLTVIHQDGPDSYHVGETVKTAQGSRNMGLDGTTHRLFIPAAKFGPPPGGSRAPVLPGTFSLRVVERQAAGR